MNRIRVKFLIVTLLVLTACSSVEASSTPAASAEVQTLAQAKRGPNCGFNCWHDGITTTYESGGAPAGDGDGGQTNATSAWYSNWRKHLCTVDHDGTRALVMKGCDNLFYFALPCGDFNDRGPIQANIRLSPWAYARVASGQSWFKNKWIEVQLQKKDPITGQYRPVPGAVIEAQWQDVGPMGQMGQEKSDCPYVFGGQRPLMETLHHANSALDISPRAFRILTNGNLDIGVIKTRWRFIRRPTPGPWTKNISTSGPDW